MPRAREVSELFICWMTMDAVRARLWSKLKSGLVSDLGDVACVGSVPPDKGVVSTRTLTDWYCTGTREYAAAARPRAPKNAGMAMYQRRTRTITVCQKSTAPSLSNRV